MSDNSLQTDGVNLKMEIYGICIYRKKFDNCKYLISNYTCIIHDLEEIILLSLHDTIFILNSLHVKMSIYLIFINKMRYIFNTKSAFIILNLFV